MKSGQKILVIRNDRLGDFMLAWPALAMLRKNLPAAHIAALVPGYTTPLAQACPYIDEVILDPKLKGELRNGLALAQLLKPKKFSAVITFFSRFDTGMGVWLAGIPQRYAPATKLAQVFYNHRLVQHRSRSNKPEFKYNLDMVHVYLSEQGVASPKTAQAPYWTFPPDITKVLEHRFREVNKIPMNRRLVFVHAGHGGSAANLSLTQYADLIHWLAAHKELHFVLTAGPGEEQQVLQLSGLLSNLPHTVYISRDGLLDFARHLQFCNVFISGSTGPLHIAGVLNCRTAAFYPRRRSSTALRWQTANAEDRRLAFEPPDGSGESDMQTLDIQSAAVEISQRYFK